MKPITLRCLLPLLVPAMIGTAGAVTTYTETFDAGANGWLNNGSPNATPTHVTTGGIDNSGYVSFTAASIVAGPPSQPGAPGATQLMFRANDANNASGDAFVGNWISSGVDTMTISLRHNNATSLDFYIRIAGGPPGSGASLAAGYTVLPNVWTTLTIPIVDSPSSFVSYGAPGSTFNGVFSSVANMQLGFYLPEGTYTNLTMDLDNVGINAVPEPSAILLGVSAAGFAFLRRRRA